MRDDNNYNDNFENNVQLENSHDELNHRERDRNMYSTRKRLEEERERRRRLYENGYYNKEHQNTYVRDRNRDEKPTRKGGFGKFVALALVLSLLGSMLGGFIGYNLAVNNLPQVASTNPTENQENVTITPRDDMTTVTAVAQANLDSVVGISSTSNLRDYFNRPVASQGMGSGFIVDERGYILTNDHVVANLSSQTGYSADVGYADEIAVVFNDGTQLPAEVLWSDSGLDLAVLKVEPEKPLKVAKLGDSENLVIGEQVIAIGNPLAIEFHGTVTAGYISGLDRVLRGAGGIEMSLIQTDASINPGNSGGPLLNAEGEVIGINTMKISTAEGLGFSIPINVAKPIINEIIETGNFEKATLGFVGGELEPMENYLGRKLADHGVFVREVIPGSPIERAGIVSEDIVTELDGKPVNSMSELQRMLFEYKFGDNVELKYIRNGEEQTTNVEFFRYNSNN